MKNIYEEMLAIPEFLAFMDRYKESANFFVATENSDKSWAVLLCMAAAFKAGMEIKNDSD